jgi:hypothetical protein
VDHFICHFHFLRDIGKDLLSTENDLLRKRLRSHGIQSSLRKYALKLKPLVESAPDHIDALSTMLCSPSPAQLHTTASPTLIMYVLIHWALEGKHDGDGYGFPFDRPYLTFYQRLRLIHQVFDHLRYQYHQIAKPHDRLAGILWKHLLDVITDPLLRKATTRMEEKATMFDRLRTAMRIALPKDQNGLNDNGDTNLTTIRRGVERFQHSLTEQLRRRPDSDYRGMHDQIQLYWNKLFADPIIKNTPTGPVVIYPQRTNNLLERFFRDLRRNHRKRSGTNILSRTLKAILTDTPLISNLSNEPYRRMLLSNANSLEARFAQIDVKLVREKLRREEEEKRNLSPKVKQILRTPDLITRITCVACACQ